MGITLNRNSWHFKYYSAVISDTPPRSLCPYFWTMVLLIILSPFFGIAASIYWVGKQASNLTDYLKRTFKSKKPKVSPPKKSIDDLIAEMEKRREVELKRSLKWNKAADVISKIFKWGILPIMCLFLLYILGDGIYQAGWITTLIVLGVTSLIVLAVLGLITLLDNYGEMMGEGIVKFFKFINPLNWKFVIVIGEMIKTAYTKACPLITWEGEKPKEINPYHSEEY